MGGWELAAAKEGDLRAKDRLIGLLLAEIDRKDAQIKEQQRRDAWDACRMTLKANEEGTLDHLTVRVSENGDISTFKADIAAATREVIDLAGAEQAERESLREALRQPASPPPLTAAAFDALLKDSAVFRELAEDFAANSAADAMTLTALENQLTQLQASFDELVADKEAEKRQLAEVVAQVSVGSAFVSEFVGQDAKAQDGEGRLGAAIAEMKAQMGKGREQVKIPLTPIEVSLRPDDAKDEERQQ